MCIVLFTTIYHRHGICFILSSPCIKSILQTNRNQNNPTHLTHTTMNSDNLSFKTNFRFRSSCHFRFSLCYFRPISGSGSPFETVNRVHPEQFSLSFQLEFEFRPVSIYNQPLVSFVCLHMIIFGGTSDQWL